MKPHPVRFGILLVILAIALGGLCYDYFVATPAVKATNDRLHETILAHNQVGFKPAQKDGATDDSVTSKGEKGGLLYQDDIHEILRMAPTYTTETEYYTIEHYRWWGWIPLNKNFITVLYVGKPGKRRYSSHYANAMPDEISLPKKPGDPPVVLTQNPNASLPVAAAAPAAGEPASPAPAPVSGEKKAERQSKSDAEPKKPQEPKVTDNPKEPSALDKQPAEK